MTREHKISLILGFAVALIVGVMVSDHLSKARQTPLGAAEGAEELTPDPLALPSVRAEEPSLVLVDERGRPEPLAQIAATTLPDAESAPEQTQVALDRTGFDVLIDEVGGALRDLKNGHVPPAAVQTDVPTMVMGHPSVGPADHPDARPTPTPTRTPALEPAQPSTPSGFTLYTIQPGDSLWKLAQRFLGDGHRHAELAELNRGRIGADGSLRVGASIKIPGSASSGSSARTVPTSKPAFPADPPKGATTYTVQAGDTLGEISQKFLGTSKRFNDIVNANRDQIDDADDIRVGMVLKIPAR